MRPRASDTGPYTIWHSPKATKNAIRVICTAEVGVLRSAAMVGSAGRYMSIAKGPTADNNPSTSAFLAKRDAMAFSFDGERSATESGPDRRPVNPAV